jgi:hypothetical protein
MCFGPSLTPKSSCSTISLEHQVVREFPYPKTPLQGAFGIGRIQSFQRFVRPSDQMLQRAVRSNKPNSSTTKKTRPNAPTSSRTKQTEFLMTKTTRRQGIPLFQAPIERGVWYRSNPIVSAICETERPNAPTSGKIKQTEFLDDQENRILRCCEYLED